MSNRPPTFDHLKKKKPPEKSVTIVLDQELMDAYEDATSDLSLSRRIYGDQANNAQDEQQREKAKQKIAEAEEAFNEARRRVEEEGTVTFRFRALKRKDYDDLVRKHPATEEQNKEHRELFGVPAGFDGETFAPAIIAASAVEPRLTEEEVSQLIHGYPCDQHEEDDPSDCSECDDNGLIQSGWTTAEISDLFGAALEINTQRRSVELGKDRGKIRRGVK